MMPLLFNQLYKSVCFIVVPVPPSWTLLTNEVLAQSRCFLFSVIELADLKMFCML